MPEARTQLGTVYWHWGVCQTRHCSVYPLLLYLPCPTSQANMPSTVYVLRPLFHPPGQASGLAGYALPPPYPTGHWLNPRTHSGLLPLCYQQCLDLMVNLDWIQWQNMGTCRTARKECRFCQSIPKYYMSGNTRPIAGLKSQSTRATGHVLRTFRDRWKGLQLSFQILVPYLCSHQLCLVILDNKRWTNKNSKKSNLVAKFLLNFDYLKLSECSGSNSDIKATSYNCCTAIQFQSF